MGVTSVTMRIEEHIKGIKESVRLLEYSIEKGLVDNQRTIGFNTSAAAVDMLEILLHKKSLIDPGFIVKHDWFLSKNKVQEKIVFDFPKKKEIIEIIMKIEEKRNILCYGKRQPENIIRESIEHFNKLKVIFKEAGLNEEI